MNVTSDLLFANENNSEQTYVWNSTETTPMSEPRWSMTWTYFIVTVQWIIFFVGSVGNITVLAVLLWRRSDSQVITQLLVGSLAVSDIGLMFSTVWVQAYDLLRKNWQFGVIPCKFKFLWQLLTMNCSIWTLAILSIDRYLRALNIFTIYSWSCNCNDIANLCYCNYFTSRFSRFLPERQYVTFEYLLSQIRLYVCRLTTYL